MKTIVRKLRQGLDRAIYEGRSKQFLWIIGILVLGFLFLSVVAWLIDFGDPTSPTLPAPDSFNPSIRILELLLDPGAFIGSNKYGSVWFQLLAVFIGSVLFTSFLIGAIGNLLSRRIESISNGHYSYNFEDHIVILGAGSALENLMLQIMGSKDDCNCDIVILTCEDVESVRESIMSYYDKKKMKNVYVIFGKRTHERSLEAICINQSRSIYIIGEDEEQQHDGQSLNAWHFVKKLCAGSFLRKECYLLLDRFTTHSVFSHKSDSGSTDDLKLNVISAVDNTAQGVLVTGQMKNISYPFLDRNGIDKDSDIHVHFIVVGMTQIAYAMATTAAHICHFPNFRTKHLRTKITFIQKDIQQELDFWMGRFDSLMDLSYAEIVSWDVSGSKKVEKIYPKQEYLNPKYYDNKGFLDIEWEFIDAGIENQNVRQYIRDCVSVDGILEYLSFAFCEHDAETNVAAAMYLPNEVYLKNDIPVYVYQPLTSYVLEAAQKTNKFSNIYPFGMRTDCFDSHHERLEWAKKIKYVYDKGGKYTTMERRQDELDARWYDTSNRYVDQLSNIYSANSIPTKFRSIFINPSDEPKLSEENVEILAEIEHNRWNVEKLLNGFRALPYVDRMDIILGRMSFDYETRKNADDRRNRLKKYDFIHADIAPFEELIKSSKSYDYEIVRKLLDVIRK